MFTIGRSKRVSGTRAPRPVSVNFFSISCSFWGKWQKIIGWRPRSGKFWNRHRLLHSNYDPQFFSKLNGIRSGNLPQKEKSQLKYQIFRKKLFIAKTSLDRRKDNKPFQNFNSPILSNYIKNKKCSFRMQFLPKL